MFETLNKIIGGKKNLLEVTKGGTVPSRPPARHFLKATGPDQKTMAGTPPGKGAESRDVGWGPSAGAERPIRGKMLLGCFFLLSARRV